MRIEIIKKKLTVFILEAYPWFYTARNISLVLGSYLGQHYG